MYTNKLTSVPLPHEFWRMGRSPEWLLFPAAGTDKYSEKQNNKKKTSFNGTLQQTVSIFYLADLSCVCMFSLFQWCKQYTEVHLGKKWKKVQYKIHFDIASAILIQLHIETKWEEVQNMERCTV